MQKKFVSYKKNSDICFKFVYANRDEVTTMTIQKLEELLKREESEKLDFKLEFKLNLESQKKELVKDVCAIANSKGGRGYIIFGIKDKTKEVVGVTTEIFDEERVQQIISSRIDPPVPIRLEEVEYLGKKIVVLTIFKSEHLPHQVLQSGTFYLRRGSTSDIARRFEVAAMLQENGLLSWESILIHKASLNDLDWNLLRSTVSKNLRIKNKTSLIHLESLGILGKENNNSTFFPTAGGLLLFGKKPQNFFLASGIQIEKDRSTLLLEGNLFSILQQAYQHLELILTEFHYPTSAVFESVFNAVAHRDYWDMSRQITITIHPKKVEITNPGAVPKTSGAIHLEDGLVPLRRNPWLYQKLLSLSKIEDTSTLLTGIRNIQNSFPTLENSVKFINLPKKNLFKVVLPGTSEWRKAMEPALALNKEE